MNSSFTVNCKRFCLITKFVIISNVTVSFPVNEKKKKLKVCYLLFFINSSFTVKFKRFCLITKFVIISNVTISVPVNEEKCHKLVNLHCRNSFMFSFCNLLLLFYHDYVICKSELS